jgi:hypothetical protein
LKKVREEVGTPLILDSGNLFFNQNPIPDEMKAQMRLKGDLIADAYMRIGIDAMNVGELDLAIGIDYLLKKGLPLVSSNLVYGDGKTVFHPYVTREVNRVKVAIFGLISPLPPQGLGNGKGLKVLNPAETARSMVKRLKGRADLIILLSNLGQQDDERLAREVQGIGVIVGGRSRVLLQTPVKVGNTLILQAAAQGKYIGRLDFDPAARTFLNTITPMDDKVSKDEGIDGMVKRHKDAVAGLHAEAPRPQEPSLKTFMGEAACAKCHPGQSSFWKGTGHARAYETLVKKNSQRDPECVRCHTTGYGIPGGFRLGLETPDLKGVQCESCHGQGSSHRGKGDIRRIVDESVCRGCHDAERSPRFNLISSIGKVRCQK